MTTITRDMLAQAAQEGTSIAHLAPGQAWAAHRLAIPPERLEKPLAPHIAVLLDSIEQKERRAFFGSISHPEDSEGMIQAAYDEQHPMFLRGPILEILREGMDKFFPTLKPCGVDDDGNAAYRLSDIAEALDTSEEELLAYAEEKGLTDKLRTGSIHPLH